MFFPPPYLHLTILKLFFFVTDSISGKSVVLKRFETLTNESCRLTFQMLPDQEIYNFTLTGHNPLGQAESVIFINVTERGELLLPARVYK